MLLSKLVREMNDYRCLQPWSDNCIFSVEKGTPESAQMHCSHNIGRAIFGTRFVWMNCISSCVFCHRFSEPRKHLINDAISSHYGSEAAELVDCLDAAYRRKGTAFFRQKPWSAKSPYREQIHQFHREELKRIEKMRKQGWVGLLLPSMEPYVDLLKEFFGQDWKGELGNA